MLGIYESSIKKISFETGIKRDDIEKALKEFERLKKVKYVNNYVILINYMKHQNFNTNMKKSAIDVYNSLPNELKVKGVTISKSNPLEGFETLLNCFAMVRKVEVEYEVESEKESKDEYKKEKAFVFRIALIDYGFDKDLVDDWLSVRKTKKATNTKTAFDGFIKEVEKSNNDKDQILKTCIEKSWSGFKTEWLNNLNNNSNNNVAAPRNHGRDLG